MRQRLTHFPGLRIHLEPGWYVVPSHVTPAEVERLLDVLISGVAGVSRVLIADLSDIGNASLADALTYVWVPRGCEGLAEIMLGPNVDARVGLMQYAEPSRWPEIAWDELEVKSALVSWWRKEISQPSHPLRSLGVDQLPIDLLAKATSEPIEFLELVEGAIAIRVERRASWQNCVWQCVAQRLDRRLRRADERTRVRLLSSVEDTWRYVADEDEGLLRSGLAMESNGHTVLTPLARMIENAEVRMLLNQRHPIMRQATTSSVAVLHDPSGLAFESSGALEPTDSRYVDLEAEFPNESRGPRSRIVAHLRNARSQGRFASIVLLQQTGIGGSTLIRAALAQLAPEGIVPLVIDLAPPSDVDLGAAVHRAIVEWMIERSIAGSALPDVDTLVTTIHDHLAARGQQLCVVMDNLERGEDRGRIVREAFAARLQAWPCHWIRAMAVADDAYGWVTKNAPAVVWMPCLPVRSSKAVDEPMETGKRLVRKLLERRIDSIATFEDFDACVSMLSKVSGGHMGHLFSLARLALMAAGREKVGVRHVGEAAVALAQSLAANVRPRDWWRLERLDGMVGTFRHLAETDERLVLDCMVLPYSSEPRWFIHPLLYWLSPFRRSTAPLPSPAILYVGVNPINVEPLDLERETAILQRAMGDVGSVHVLTNVTVDDLRKVVIERNYDVLHLAGHGGRGEFIMMDDAGNNYVVPSQAIVRLWAGVRFRCVILSFSDSAAVVPPGSALDQPIIAAQDMLEDRAALAFTRGFYESLAAGKQISECFAEARLRLELHGHDPNVFVLFEPPSS